MEMRALSEDCVRVEVCGEECARMDISYDSFTPDNAAARLFIAAVIAQMESLGAVLDRTKKLTAEIFPREGGGLVLFISGKGLQCEGIVPAGHSFAALFCSPDRLTAAVGELSERTSAELYRFGTAYALIADTRFTGGRDSPILAAKIREYGVLLSDSPFGLLKE